MPMCHWQEYQSTQGSSEDHRDMPCNVQIQLNTRRDKWKVVPVPSCGAETPHRRTWPSARPPELLSVHAPPPVPAPALPAARPLRPRPPVSCNIAEFHELRIPSQHRTNTSNTGRQESCDLLGTTGRLDSGGQQAHTHAVLFTHHVHHGRELRSTEHRKHRRTRACANKLVRKG